MSTLYLRISTLGELGKRTPRGHETQLGPRWANSAEYKTQNPHCCFYPLDTLGCMVHLGEIKTCKTKMGKTRIF